MAEDIDVEAMLEAPYKKDTYEVYIGFTPPSSFPHRTAVDGLPRSLSTINHPIDDSTQL